jgi:hypothetical protein
MACDPALSIGEMSVPVTGKIEALAASAATRLT